MRMSDIVPRDRLAAAGVRAVIAVAGGIGILALAGIGGLPGIIVGGALTVIGLAFSGSKSEKGAGIATAAVGAAVLVSSIPILHGLFGGLFHWLMRAAGVVLLGLGGFSLYRFVTGLRKRM
jgi:hypothetical protein